MSYADYLDSRGYRRITVERTAKRGGDLVLNDTRSPLERIEPAQNVVAMRREKRRG